MAVFGGGGRGGTIGLCRCKSRQVKLVLAALFLVCHLTSLLSFAEGSHFRYGTLSWEPLNSYVGTTRKVQFTFKAAFRKNYHWGSHADEQWAQTNSASSAKLFYGSEGSLTTSSAGYDANLPGCNITGNTVQKKLCFNCPDGSVTSVFGCENHSPQYDRLLTDSNGNGNFGEKFYVRFPSLKQLDGSDIVQCPDPFTCDINKAIVDADTKIPLFTKTDNSAQRDLCKEYRNNPTKDPNKCAPWDEVYGMFMGDGTSKTIEFEVSYIHESDNSIVGNYLLGASKFEHFYEQDTADPFLAYFTGGDRAYECDYPTTSLTSDGQCVGTLNRLLRNNVEGRYRLETTVNLKTGVTNRSPVAAMMPVLPIPVTSTVGERARFQITAYDVEGDDLSFRFGNVHEMGGILRSKTDAFPWSTNPTNTQVYDATTGEMGSSFGVQYGRFYCDETSKQYLLDGKCPADRVPESVLGMDVYSFKSIVPGLVEWNTWRRLKTNGDYEACIESKTGCEKMPQGLYNVVVIVSDGNSKVSIDFMVYLYDGQMHFCNKHCKDNKKAAPNPEDVTQNSYLDNYKGTTYSPSYAGVETFADRDGIYGADFLVEGTALRFAQSCTICGIGSANNGACTPLSADNKCGTVSLGSIVPSTGACIINQPPKFVSDGTISISPGKSIVDSPGLDEFNANKALGSSGALDGNYELPKVTGYYGKDLTFSVTAQDDDDCAELLVEHTIAPDGAYLEDAEYLVNYDAFPNGQKVRKRFTWPAEGDASTDTRAEKSKACFYAFDKYLVTATPFYCVEIVLIQMPPTTDEVLARFDCKLSLNWNELLGRFTVSDELNTFYSSCKYEGYMWHHAMVSIDSSGDGALFIDGKKSDLEINVGINVDDPATFNSGTKIGDTFSTMTYPNRCISSSRRQLSATALSPSDQNANLGYANLTGSNLNPATGDCCSFKIGQKCTDNSIRTYEGLADEVAVWNRALSEEEIQHAMFHMPSHVFDRKLVAPRGIQTDIGAGRVLWARFNNPCVDRSAGVQDASGLTAGTIDGATGALTVTDSNDDVVSWLDFKTHTKYAYTGVPWLAPYIHEMNTPSHLAIDGGSSITVSGVGFAKSPFLKCINSYFGTNETPSGAYSAFYEVGARTRSYPSESFEDSSYLERVSKSIGTPLLTFDASAPYLFRESLSYPTNAASRADSWDIKKNKAVLRNGAIPVFEDIPSRAGFTSNPNTHGETIHGSWEVISCGAPSAALPSDKYELSVSNDAGLSVTNLKTKTYTEYSLVLDGSVALSADTQILGKTYSMWFMIHEVRLTYANLFSLSNGLGFTYEDGIVYANYGTQKLGSLGEVTSLNIWHHIAISIDGGQTRAYIDGKTVVDIAMPDISYALQSIGNNFVGKIDEFKVLTKALSTEEIMKVALRRELDLSSMHAYYRFNENFNDFTGNTTLSVIGKNNAQFVSVGAPWEPVSIYTVNGLPIESVPQLSHGGDTLSLTGFNFAPSEWLKCHFGEKVQEYTMEVPVPQTNATATCALVSTGMLDRPDSKSQRIGGMEISSTQGSSSIATYDSMTKASCPGVSTSADIVDFNVGSTIEDSAQLGMSETSLECSGDGEFAVLQGVTEKLAGGDGFTFSLWVQPYSSAIQRTGAEASYTSLLGEQVAAESSSAAPSDLVTILAIQSGTSELDLALILYDKKQSKFVYYDDYIHSVSSKKTSDSHKWHHLFLSIDANGLGNFTVNGETTEFTSSTAIPSDSEMTLCASKPFSKAASSFFHGLVDDLLILKNASLSYSEVKGMHPLQSATEEVVAYFPMNRGSAGLDGTVSGVSATTTGTFRTLSAGPWALPKVLKMSPTFGSINGGTTVTIDGLNFAQTEDFKVLFGSKAGVVQSITTNRIVVSSPPGSCLSRVDISLSLMGFTYPLGSTFDYKPSMSDLQYKLVSHYTMDAPKYAVNSTNIEVFDIVSSRNGLASGSAAATNRDSVLKSALGTDGLSLPAPSSYLGENFTICVWLKISDFEKTKSSSHVLELFEAWKMFCSVSNTKMYVNYEEASAAQAEFLSPMFGNFLTTGKLGPMKMTVDDVWIYDRELTSCEIAARYYTAQSSIQIGDADNIVATVDSQSTTFQGLEAWIYLDSSQGTHTVAASSIGTWGFGVRDGNLFLRVSTATCACGDTCYEQYISTKTSVPAKQWVHVAVSYDKGKARYFIDGILLDQSTFVGQVEPELNSILLGTSPTSAVDSSVDALGGQLYDIRFRKAEDFFAHSVKKGVQCPPTDLELGGSTLAGFSLNEGSAGTLRGYTSLESTSVSLVSSGSIQWINSTYDDAAFADNTKVNIEGLGTWQSGYTIFFTISSHTACGKLKTHGGEKYTATFQKVGTSTLIDASVVDTNDGNYHVHVNGLTCGTYRVTVASLSGFFQLFDIKVVSQDTSAAHTIVSTIQSEQCFGAPFKMEIEAYDAYGCPSLTGTDQYSVKLKGPHDASAVTSYAGNGKYVAEFTPLASGKFFAEFNLLNGNTSAPLQTPYRCIDVCSGSSLEVDGVSGVEISEAGLPVDSDHATELDMSNTNSGTLKAWINPSGITEGDAYIIVKQSASDAQSSRFVKGYTLKLSSDYSVLEGTIYAGLGKLANITANTTIGLGSWAHVAFTYKEEEMKLFVDGEIVAEKKIEWGPISNFANPYTIPLSIGQGFVGSIDEVTLLTVAQSPEVLKEQLYCPPIGGNYEDVLVYLPFNGYSDEASKTIPVYGKTCKPNVQSSTCPAVSVFGNPTISNLVSPLTNLVAGVGTPGTRYSSIESPPYTFTSSYLSIKTEFEIVARDVCGFVYMEGASGAFGLQVEKEEKVYISTDGPGKEYPATTYGEAVSIVAALKNNEINTCYASVASHPYVTGNVYTQSLSVDVSGDYKLSLVANSSELFELGNPVTAHAESTIPHSITILEPTKTYVAGATSTLRIQVQDSAGNKITSENLDLQFEMTLLGSSITANIPVAVHYEPESETHILTFKLLSVASPSGYSLLFLHGGSLIPSDVHPLVLNVEEADFRALVADQSLLSDEDGKFRSGHTTALHKGDLYVFGGADKMSAYSSQMLVLEGVETSVENSFLYKKRVTVAVSSVSTAQEETFPLEIRVNTKELFDAGRILPNCQDIMFTLEDNAQFYYLDPDSGCQSEETIFYLKLTTSTLSAAKDGQLVINMLYGNPSMLDSASSDYMKPKEIFEFYEDFESGTLGTFQLVNTCKLLTEQVFTVSSAFSKYGEKSLQTNSSAGMGALMSGMPTLEYFHLKAWFWDSNAEESANFISPDYENACSNTTAESGTAVGTFTTSHKTKICFGHPWESSSVARTAEWKLLEVISSTGGSSIRVNGEIQTNSSKIVLDKILIKAGGTHSISLWDNVMVLRLSSNPQLENLQVTVEPMQLDTRTLETGHAADKAVWKEVTPSTSVSPPARYGHSSVYHQGKKYIFGGERNTYLFNDIWCYDFDQSAWSHVVPNGGAVPSARVMHSAVLSEPLGKMIIYGGRSSDGTLLSDVWEFDLVQEKWSLLANVTAMSARMGHSASIVKNYMYVFGGKLSLTAAVQSDSVFFRCEVSDMSKCEDLTYGCPEAPATSKTIASIGLGPRYKHTASTRDGSLYLFGGSDPSQDDDVETQGLFSFDADACEWNQLLLKSASLTGEEHSAAMGNQAMYLFGGHSRGKFLSSHVRAYLF